MAISVGKACILKHQTRELFQKLESELVDFQFLRNWEDRNKSFASICEQIKNCYKLQPDASCLAYIEKRVIPHFWVDELHQVGSPQSDSSSAKFGSHSVAILVLLKTLSVDAFNRQALKIKKNTKMASSFCKIIVENQDFDKDFHETILSIENMIPAIINSINANTELNSCGSYYNRLMPFLKEFSAALPEIAVRCPTFIQYLIERHPEVFKTDSPLRLPTENSIVHFCKTVVTSPFDSQLIFLNVLVKINKEYEKLRKECYQVYFKKAKTTRNAVRIIHELLERGKTKHNEEEALYFIAELLRVPKESLNFKSMSDDRIAELTKIAHNEGLKADGILELDRLFETSFRDRLDHFFKYATVELNVQLEALHTGFCAVIDGNVKNTQPLARKFGPIILHGVPNETVTAQTDTPTLKENAESIPNPHYGKVMASLKKPQGISVAQIELACRWWGAHLRNRTANSVNSLLFSGHYFQTGNNPAFAKEIINQKGESEENILKFEAALKKRLLPNVGLFQLREYLNVDYEPCNILAGALTEAGISAYSDLPWKTNMRIEGNDALNEGSITVNGQPLAKITVSSMENEKLAMCKQAAAGAAAMSSSSSSSSIVCGAMQASHQNTKQGMDVKVLLENNNTAAETCKTKNDTPSLNPDQKQKRDVESNPELVKLLMQCLTIKDNLKPPTPELAFRRAAAMGNVNLLEQLVSLVPDLNINEGGPDTGKTALDFAETHGQVEAVQYLRSLGAKSGLSDNSSANLKSKK